MAPSNGGSHGRFTEWTQMRELVLEILAVYGMKPSEDEWVEDLADDLMELFENG